MPLDARPDMDADQSGYLSPAEAAQLTPIGTIREPYFAGLIEAVRAIVDGVPTASK
jgi:hypothetical protein